MPATVRTVVGSCLFRSDAQGAKLVVSLLGMLKSRREAFLDQHAAAGDWRSWGFSAATLSLWRACRGETASLEGRILDAGSGRGAWRELICQSGADYESIDVEPRGGDRPTWVGDIMSMPEVPSERYDAVVSHQVLEHVPRPWEAVAEFSRVLRPGGRLVISVPHLSRRHELPHDYFRFTQEGLHALLSDAGFVNIRLQPFGGLLCFVHHQVSCIFPGLLAPVPVLGKLLAMLNLPLAWLSCVFDRMIDRASLAPVGVLATAERRKSADA